MEIEVKLAFQSEADLLRLEEHLVAGAVAGVTASPEGAHFQRNHFFDGSEKELSSDRIVLRLREAYLFPDHPTAAPFRAEEGVLGTPLPPILTCKARAKIVEGVAQGQEVEGELVGVTPGEAAASPELVLLQADHPAIQKLHTFVQPRELVYVGNFANFRRRLKVAGVPGLTRPLLLELDTTTFAFGTAWELECEMPLDDTEAFKAWIDATLKDLMIPYSFSTVNKFVKFARGHL